jgi:hypothetical protein
MLFATCSEATVVFISLSLQFASGAVALWYDDGSQLELQSSASAAFKYINPQGREIM